ncbi:MAG: hypothetical protein Q7S76_00635 [bacterium]|nr:hypothetical protein [bacterium]
MPFEMYHVTTGLIGGLIRALVGITKSKTFTPKTFRLDWQYFAVSLFVSAVVGVMAGIIADNDWRTSLLAGYAGTDFLENLYKIKFTKLAQEDVM